MHIIKTLLESVQVIQPTIFEDNRGFFFESYQKEKFQGLGINTDFIQDNQSFSVEIGTIRGMHFQSPPFAQTKLIRVIQGAIENVIIDIRKGSPTFKQYASVKLSAENKLLLYLPVGFANGFKTLEKNCEVQYKVDKFYNKDHDFAFDFNDTEFGIKWDVVNPILSNRDAQAPQFAEIQNPFIYGLNS